MTVATWNLERVRPGSGVRTQRLRRALEMIDADVWVLTETHREFSPGASYREAAVSGTAPDRTDGERWVSLWVRDSLMALPLTLRGEPERSAAVRVACGPSRQVVVAGTVLPWRADTASGVRGSAKFEQSLRAQAEDWRTLRSLYPGDSFCVAGDFNQELAANGPVGTRRGREVLTEVLDAHRLFCLTAGARDPLLQRGWCASIDHIAVSDDLAVMAQDITVWPDEFPLSRRMSDHYGVCVNFMSVDAPHREL